MKYFLIDFVKKNLKICVTIFVNQNKNLLNFKIFNKIGPYFHYVKKFKILRIF